MKYFCFITILVLTITLSYSQESDTTKVSETVENKYPIPGLDEGRVYYGGYMSLSFGGTSMVGIKPLVGYKFTPKLSGGVQLSYEYYEINYMSASNFGASVFARYRVTPKIYFHSEFLFMNYYEPIYYHKENDRNWVPLLFLGGGYSYPISKRTWLTAQVLFDVLQHEDSPYKSFEPFFSIGVGVGF